MKPNNALQVLYDERLVGTLAMTADHKAAFQYSEEWLEHGFPISPFSLPLKRQVFVPNKDYFDGLFGVFADSLPDNWGRLLLNRLLRAHGQNPDKLTVLERLAIVGKSGMGALTYYPEKEMQEKQGHSNLDELAEQCQKLLNTEYSDKLDALELNGNLEISNVDWRADTYLNGHEFTAGEEVAQSQWRYSYTKLYASSKKDSVEANPVISISSGQFEIYGCAEKAELTGDVEITVDGTAAVKVIGAESGSKLNGNINVTINGNNGATLDSFIGRESSAEVTGNLELKLEGTVQLSKWGGTYEAIHYNSKDVWGTLDLTEAKMSEDDIKRFSGFETVKGVDDEEAAEEISEEIPDAAEKKSESDVIDETTEEIKEETVKKDESKKDETADSNEIISSDDTDDSEDASESDDDNDQIKEEEKSEDETVGTDEDTQNGSESADENDAEDAKDDADEEEAEEIQTSDTDADLAEEIVED